MPLEQAKIAGRIDIEQRLEFRNRECVLTQPFRQRLPRSSRAPWDRVQHAGRAPSKSQQVESAVRGWTEDRIVTSHQIESGFQVIAREPGRIGPDRNASRSIHQSTSHDGFDPAAQIALALKPDVLSRNTHRKPAGPGGCQHRTNTPAGRDRAPGIEKHRAGQLHHACRPQSRNQTRFRRFRRLCEDAYRDGGWHSHRWFDCPTSLTRMSFEYDMIVIGAGAAGLTGAGMSALLGAKTALIERDRLGGDCTWTGCIPSKTLLRAARAAHEMRTADRFGLIAAEPRFEFSRVMDHVRRTRQHVYDDADAPPHMERLGVEVVKGAVSFVDPHAIQVENGPTPPRRLTSRFFMIATGSRPKMPAFSVTPLTNETVFELESPPKRLLIGGAGPVGLELAQAFIRLGSNVQVIASGNRILPRDDPEHASMLQQSLTAEGVTFDFGHKAIGLDKGPDGLAATLDDGRTISCDAFLAAMGREPAIQGLRLENAGVRTGQKGVVIDRHCRTAQRHIYAVGDVTGRYNFTHMAEHMSKVAVTNALLRWPQKLDEKHLVWCTFTDPELAHLGESEAGLLDRKAKFTVLRFPFAKLDRAITEAETTGEVKVFAGRSGRILGASILGAHAGEMISEYALAMRNGLRLQRISRTVHPYPTFLLGNRRAADEFLSRQLDSPILTALGRILRYRGRVRDIEVES